MTTRAFGCNDTAANTFSPRLIGAHGAIACEHYLAAQAGRDVLGAGGNAVDAAVAATLIEGIANPQMHTLGGECPMLIRMADSARVVCVNGNTNAPALATPAAYRERGLDEVPEEGILAAGVPATLDALLHALKRFGRLRFADVAAPALNLAREGVPVHRGMLHQPRYGLVDLAAKFRQRWPASAQIYLPNGEPPGVGARLQNPALADLLEMLVHCESGAGGDRGHGIQAVRDGFYRGDPATEIDRYSRARAGLLRRTDLEVFESHIEAPVQRVFRGATVFKCGPWNQGPVMLQALAVLDHFAIEKLRPDGPEYLHLLIEAMKLAFADREQYYGDPRQIEVPIDALLSTEYARERAALIDRQQADAELRPGDPRTLSASLPVDARLGGRAWGAGTVHVDVIDGDGNMASFTPSGGWIRSAEVIPALGLPLGNRLMTFYLGPDHHPNVIAPGKQPRTTISPSLALLDDEPWMCFGSMGGDQQDQWQLQFFLNRLIFGMPIQAAIEAPKLSSEHFPGFFAPHQRIARRVCMEPRFDQATLDELTRRGHDIEVVPDWTEGYLLAVAREPEHGLLEAGCDPRGAKSDVFPAFALAW